MTERVLRFHFDYISPYSYLAWHRLKRFAPEHDLVVEPKPTLFAGLLNEHGHKGPGEIEPKRMYMFKDCIRGAALLGLPFEPPATHPFNPLASLRASLLDMEDDTRSELITRLYSATWVEGLDVGSPEVVAGICTEVGIPDAAERIRDPAIKQRLFDAGREAIALGVFGVPAMIVDGELFWGTDSFPHLERFLAGEDPVRAEDTARWAAVKPSAQR
jgi:2-hydroxychromene-2-carboxylate isomerase